MQIGHHKSLSLKKTVKKNWPKLKTVKNYIFSAFLGHPVVLVNLIKSSKFSTFST